MKTFMICTCTALLCLFTGPAFSQTSHTVQVSNDVFTPSSLTITKGDTVTWVWVNGSHTTTSDSTTGVEVWNAPIDQSHPSFSFVFTLTGLFHYHCAYHSSLGMTGTINVQSPASVMYEDSQPADYQLEQNYPNPFNPSTRITYSLARAGFVTLEIYNPLGDVVRTLVNQRQSAGKYTVQFSFDNLPSGVYLYKLQAGNFVSVKKMVLMK